MTAAIHSDKATHQGILPQLSASAVQQRPRTVAVAAFFCGRAVDCDGLRRQVRCRNGRARIDWAFLRGGVLTSRLTLLALVCIAALGSSAATAYLIDRGWIPAISGTSSGYNVALGKPASQSSYFHDGRKSESQAAADGILSGGYAFHTKLEPTPWWQVDLLQTHRIFEVLVYNSPGSSAERAYSLEVTLSEDGQKFRTVYSNNGKAFGGKEGAPLRVRLNAGERAIRPRATGEGKLSASRRDHGDRNALIPPHAMRCGRRLPVTRSSCRIPSRYRRPSPAR